MINIEDIMQMIPHRYPFLLVDRIKEITPNENITGLKNVTINEPHFTGHFPNQPVMPGVLIIEALAQVSAILVGSDLKIKGEDKQVILMSISNAKFRKIVSPGDVLVLNSQILQNRGNVWKFSAKAYVEDQVVTDCELMAMIRDKE
ncbi:MAG: 3-hydroxyacyl-ACP dehydratase FabZ [Rickettsiaceae bacterium]|nr:3-hydroxyacyl-ACP dehydratase FabZ [Rickettsiaceae bacterium]